VRFHLDTTFLIDWQRVDPRIDSLRNELIAGQHELSIDPIIEAEFFAAQRVDRDKQLVFEGVQSIAEWVPLTSEACRLAGSWLARLDVPSRRRHFGDALIAATAALRDATLITADLRIARVFPVAVLEY